MASRIGIIRECLTLTGNNLYREVDDGSPEWEVSSAAFEAGVEWLTDEHSWNFATEIEEKAAELDDDDEPVAPSDPNFTYRFARPSAALYVVKVMDEGGLTLTDYRIVGNRIFANVATILVEHLVEPDPDDWPGLFTKAIKHCVM